MVDPLFQRMGNPANKRGGIGGSWQQHFNVGGLIGCSKEISLFPA